MKKEKEKELIDGKFTHQFQCSLLPAGGFIFDEFMKKSELKSPSAGMNLLLQSYSHLEFLYATSEREYDAIDRTYNYILDAVENYQKGTEALMKLSVPRCRGGSRIATKNNLSISSELVKSIQIEQLLNRTLSINSSSDTGAEIDGIDECVKLILKLIDK